MKSVIILIFSASKHFKTTTKSLKLDTRTLSLLASSVLVQCTRTRNKVFLNARSLLYPENALLDYLQS